MTGRLPLYGCIEAGGTKFVLGIAAGPEDVRATVRIDTTTPDETIGAALDWFGQTGKPLGGLTAFGIASFGPVELDRQKSDWGHITATTKPGWSHTSFAPRFAEAFKVPVGFDTDVNGAALAEYRWGAAKGQDVAVYVTVGTGIGGGATVRGTTLRGLSHPEMGHLRLPRHPADLDFAGVCPFHGDCLEGLASGPAIIARWGKSLSELPQDHPAHDIIAHYIATFATTLQSIMEPGRIVLGGGVMATPGLIERVREQAGKLGGSYFRGNASELVVRPVLGDHAGLLGALALAQDASAWG
jgi:fructokinase